MAPPLRKPAGAQVAPLRCPILRLLALIVYHAFWSLFTVLLSNVLETGITLQFLMPIFFRKKPGHLRRTGMDALLRWVVHMGDGSRSLEQAVGQAADRK